MSSPHARCEAKRVRAEQERLDLLLNDVPGGEELSEWGRPFWELDGRRGLPRQGRAGKEPISF